MKVASHEKLLGDVISSKGLADSVRATVDRRKGQVIKNIIEIRAVIEDYRANFFGAIATGVEIWEIAVLPFLLYNCETWKEITDSTISVLNDLQYKFYRNILSTPGSCPLPALLWETGGWLMQHRIALKKISFFHHLMNLPHNSLAFQVASSQARLGYPGLVAECKQIMEMQAREVSHLFYGCLVVDRVNNANHICL